MIPRNPSIAVVGATGAVGTTLLSLIAERNYPHSRVDAVASDRSSGRTVTFDDSDLVVTGISDYDFSGADLTFFSAGTSVSREWAPKATAMGSLVIDNTNAFRMDPDSHLVVPQVNAEVLKRRPTSGIIGNPNCSTIPLVRALHALRPSFPLSRVVVSTYQAASGQGLHGLAEIREATTSILAGHRRETFHSERFSRNLAFDCLPMIDEPLASGFTLEEQKMTQESNKILADSSLSVTATCVRVPVLNCHAETVYMESTEAFNLEGVYSALEGADGIVLHRDIEDSPTQATIEDVDSVHIGRVRIAVGDPRALWMWVVADNVRVGAALNAIQIAERLIARE